MIRNCTAYDFWLPAQCFLWQWRRFLYVDLNDNNIVHPREKRFSKAAWSYLFRSSWNKTSRHSVSETADHTRASSVPDPCGSPYLVHIWQLQAHLSFSEGSCAFPNDPGHCHHKIQKLTKQKWKTAAQDATSAGCHLSYLCSWTSSRFMHFNQNFLIKQPGSREQNLGFLSYALWLG